MFYTSYKEVEKGNIYFIPTKKNSFVCAFYFHSAESNSDIQWYSYEMIIMKTRITLLVFYTIQYIYEIAITIANCPIFHNTMVSEQKLKKTTKL